VTQSALEQIIEKARIDRSTTLDLSENNIVEIPSNICDLTHLTCLHLWGNKITRLPDNIGNLYNLKELFLCENPESIGNLTNLYDLNISNNQLVNLPESIQNLSSLDRLDLNNNPLVDLSILKTLPRTIKSIKFLGQDKTRKYWIKFIDRLDRSH
jgi:Leucine-rich repeat (LRR) protein